MVRTPRWDLDKGVGGRKRLPIRRPQSAAAGRAAGAGPAAGSRSRQRLIWQVGVWAAAGLLVGMALAGGALLRRSPTGATEVVRWGIVEESAQVPALVIRQEQVEVAPISGALLRLIGEGERVAFGDAVAEVVNNEARSALETRAQAVEEAWSRFEKEREGERLAARAQVADLTARVNDSLARLRQTALQADGEGMDRAWSGLERAWGDLDRSRGVLERLDYQRAQLLSEKARISSLTGEAQVRLTAPQGGVVCYQVDGLESTLRPDRLRTSDLALASQPPAVLPPAGDRVDAGQPLFKVVDASSVTLAFRLLEPEVEFLSKRGAVTLVLPPGREVEGRIVSLGPSEPGGRQGVFVRVYTQPGDPLLTTRTVEAEIRLRYAQGPRIPVSALEPDPDSPVPQETGLGVWLISGDRARWTPVTLLATDGQWAIVEGIPAGGILVSQGTSRSFR